MIYIYIYIYTEGCKSRYTVIRIIQSKTVYLLLHPLYIYKVGLRIGAMIPSRKLLTKDSLGKHNIQ